MSVRLIHGDCLAVLPTLEAGSVDAVITDPPYGLKFMGEGWDHGYPGVEFWGAIRRVLKPGGYLLAFGGTRTYHRQACAIEDAGFQIRDTVMWLYGQGFPKAKSCLKPGWDPITLAWNPAARVTPLNIDACRVELSAGDDPRLGGNGSWTTTKPQTIYGGGKGIPRGTVESSSLGRYPANLIHDGSEEVLEAFAAFGEKTTNPGVYRNPSVSNGHGFHPSRQAGTVTSEGDSGTAARFFYCAKATKADRGEGNTHPTVKPAALCRWLVRLITPPGGTVLDPFMGSGSTGLACVAEGFGFVGIESNPDYVDVARKRLDAARSRTPLFATNT